MESIRDILAAHESGISRDGLLAWARLRVDPHLTDEQLDAALAELGDEVVDVQGFLYLRAHAPEGAGPDAAAGRAVPADGGGMPPTPPPAWTSPMEPPPPGAVPEPPPAWNGDASWRAADGTDWAPAPSESGRRTMVTAAVVVAAFLVVAGVAAFLLGEGDATAPALPTPTAGVVIGAGSLAVGDCIILPSEDQFDELRRLACSEPHDGEVFYIGSHPDGDYPSDDDFRAFVDEQCLPAFAAYTGSAYDDQAVLDIGWFTPTSGAWDRGDRGVTCHLVPVNGSPTDRSWRGGNP